MPIYHTPLPATLTKLPSFSVRVTNLNVYNSLASLFINAPLGFAVIIGMSPVEMAAFVNCRITNDTHDGHATTYDNWNDVPCVIVPSEILGTTAAAPPLNVGSGDLPNGQQWAWQCSVEYFGGGVLPPNVPTFVIKTGVYTGNGTSQSIATGMDMTAAHASIMVKPLSGGGSARSAWRVTGLNGSSAVGTNTLDTTAITGLTSTGFTVGNNARANASGVKYGYVAMIDTAGTYMRVGTYTGVGNTGTSITAVNIGDTTVACGNAQPSWIGATLDFGTSQYTITGAVMNTSLTISPGWAGATGTPVLGTVLSDNRLIPVGFLPTHAWVMGGSQIYKSPEMAAAQSVSLGANGSASPMINAIKAFTSNVAGSGFAVGTNGDVNSNNFIYAYVAFKQATALQAFFTSGSKNPAGGSDTITGLPFQPGWVTTIDAAASQNGVWRAINVQVGTDSTSWAGTPDGVLDIPAQGISSLDAAGFHTGTAGMPAGHEVYWFAFIGSGSISPAPVGPFVGVCPTVRGTVAIPFWAQLTASGGTAPFTYTLILDSLPPGLILDENTGIISGTPTLAGVYPYTVRIMDATMDPTLASSVSCAITIVSVGPTPQPPAPTPTTPSGCTPSGFTPAAISSTSGCRVRSDWP